MNLYIPPLGTVLVLSQDWNFLLHPEHRNVSLFEFLGKDRDQPIYFTVPFGGFNIKEEKLFAPKPLKLPKGTVLKVDRIYIRKGKDGFDSISFTLPGQKVQVDGQTVRRQVRFWVKLEDANKIVFDNQGE